MMGKIKESLRYFIFTVYFLFLLQTIISYCRFTPYYITAMH